MRITNLLLLATAILLAFSIYNMGKIAAFERCSELINTIGIEGEP